MPIKLILNPSKEEALQMYPQGDHPHRYLKSSHRQAKVGNNPAMDLEDEKQSEHASSYISDDRSE